jgi:dissimilatory sulfite reductase (desulfoviridin) alpha/beta subunit
MVREAVTNNLEKVFETEPFLCETKQKMRTDQAILRIRTTNGEVNSQQARKIANIAENYGYGFVHFSVRGGPEIPGVKEEAIEGIKGPLNTSNPYSHQ